MTERDTAGVRHAPPQELRGPFGRRALRIGRLFGIDIGLDWSWVFIFLLITFSLVRGFARGDEDWTQAQSWTAGVLASLLFFASILLHELGHSLVSIALGLPVRSITLFIFGGLAALSGEPKRPRDEFLIAAAGPAVSVALGVILLVASAALPDRPAAASVVAAVFGWLGTVNLFLAGFNLVPGFPLDGGRLFRAVVWHFTGSFERATLAAAAAGSLFAYSLIGLGILIALLLGNFYNGLWLAFIGWFLLSAAHGSTVQVVLRRQLGDIVAGPAAAPLEPMVRADASVADAIEEVVLRRGTRAFFVQDSERPIGMVTLHELKRVPVEEREGTPVREIMLAASELVTIPYEDSLWRAFELMNGSRVNQLPVERDGRLVGVLTRERLLGIIQSVRELDRG